MNHFFQNLDLIWFLHLLKRKDKEEKVFHTRSISFRCFWTRRKAPTQIRWHVLIHIEWVIYIIAGSMLRWTGKFYLSSSKRCSGRSWKQVFLKFYNTLFLELLANNWCTKVKGKKMSQVILNHMHLISKKISRCLFRSNCVEYSPRNQPWTLLSRQSDKCLAFLFALQTILHFVTWVSFIFLLQKEHLLSKKIIIFLEMHSFHKDRTFIKTDHMLRYTEQVSINLKGLKSEYVPYPQCNKVRNQITKRRIKKIYM